MEPYDNTLSTLGYVIQEMNTPTCTIDLTFKGHDDSFTVSINGGEHQYHGTRFDEACDWLERTYADNRATLSRR